jgi:hypothetical protein
MTTRTAHLTLLLTLALVSEGIYFAIAAMDNLRNHIPMFLIGYGILFALYLTAARRYFGFGHAARSADPLSAKEILLIGITFGVIFRITLFMSTPSLSEDIYRYLWDGKIANQGVNPFRYPPNAEELSSFRDAEIYPQINHKEIPTIYPPGSQLVFQGLYRIHPSLRLFKAAFVAFDLLTIWMLYLLLKEVGSHLTRLLIYVWNPLVIVEIAGSGHADILAIFFAMASFYLVFKKHSLPATAALAISFLCKFFALIILPILAFTKKDRKLLALPLFALVAVLFYLPYADAGENLFRGLGVYGNKWEFNDSIFAIILSVVKTLLPKSWIIHFMIEPYGYSPHDPTTLATRGTDLALHISKAIVAVIFGGILVYFLRRLKNDLQRRGNIWIIKLGLILFGTLFLLSPTVQPWYLCWLVPFIAVVPNRAFLLLTGLVGLSYWILIDYSSSGVWQESLWVKLLEYLPFYALLLYDGWKTLKLKS